jgi:late competence protein required for DNA uptake (superfamily II DNA/RNA helicase)
VEGDLHLTYVECLNKSLKLRQLVRANKTSHPIRLKQIGITCVLLQEHGRISNKEEFARITQITHNNLYDVTSLSILNDLNNHIEDIKNKINSYLEREHKSWFSVFIFSSKMKEWRGFMSLAVKKKHRKG